MALKVTLGFVLDSYALLGGFLHFLLPKHRKLAFSKSNKLAEPKTTSIVPGHSLLSSLLLISIICKLFTECAPKVMKGLMLLRLVDPFS